MSLRPICVIPARLASSRFPRKLLAPFQGYPIIEHVRRRALLVEIFERVIVATCDKEIYDLVRNNGGEAVMTKHEHPNGTSRVAEAIKNIDCSHVVLLQGDEPLILPRHLKAMVDAIVERLDCKMLNAVGPIENFDELMQVSSVKCTVASNNRIIYCFRKSPAISKVNDQASYIRKLLGLIAFERDFMVELSTLPETIVCQTESIEQMKFIENGYNIGAVSLEVSVKGVNEPHDLDEVNAYFFQNAEQQICFRNAFGLNK